MNKTLKLKLPQIKQDKHKMKKINRHITSSKKLIEDKIKEVGLISAKGLTKESINGDSVLNGAIYFADNGSQNY